MRAHACASSGPAPHSQTQSPRLRLDGAEASVIVDAARGRRGRHDQQRFGDCTQLHAGRRAHQGCRTQEADSLPHCQTCAGQDRGAMATHHMFSIRLPKAQRRARYLALISVAACSMVWSVLHDVLQWDGMLAERRLRITWHRGGGIGHRWGSAAVAYPPGVAGLTQSGVRHPRIDGHGSVGRNRAVSILRWRGMARLGAMDAHRRRPCCRSCRPDSCLAWTQQACTLSRIRRSIYAQCVN